MKGRRPTRLAIALLEQLVPGNDPLAGDLLEEWRERSDAWLWRQVLFAVLTRTIVDVRTKPRVTIESALIATALLAVLGFQSLVDCRDVSEPVPLRAGRAAEAAGA